MKRNRPKLFPQIITFYNCNNAEALFTEMGLINMKRDIMSRINDLSTEGQNVAVIYNVAEINDLGK